MVMNLILDTSYLDMYGMKGKLNQLNNDGDIATMYAEFTRRTCFLFWVKCLAKAQEATFV